MGVNIDKARGEQVALSVELASRRAVDLRRHGGDARAINGYLALKSGRAATVNNARITNNQVMHNSLLRGSMRSAIYPRQARCCGNDAASDARASV